jgi:valine--pyruvate aminotransferase
VRTGIVVARPEIIRALASINAVVSLANGNLGQALVLPLLQSGELLALSREVIRPYYLEKSQQARRWLAEAFGTRPVPHPSQRRRVVSVAMVRGAAHPRRGTLSPPEAAQGADHTRSLLFFGLGDEWRHGHECIRLTFSQPAEVVQEGIAVLADEVARAYAEG